MLKKFFLGCLFLSFIAGNAGAATIDLWDLFPQTTQGENGIYLYRYNPSRSTPYQELANKGDFFFGTDWAYQAPYLKKAGAADGIVVHPAAVRQIGHAEDAVLAYVAGDDLTCDIIGEFKLRDGVGGDGIAAYIYLNDTLLWAKNISGHGSTEAFDLKNISLRDDDNLRFGISARGTDYYDSSSIKAQLVVTPEPASMVLFGLGGAAMAFSRRRGAKTNI